MSAATDRPATRWLRFHLPLWVILAFGMAVAFFLFTILRDAVDNVARLRFERQASDAKGVIAERIHSYAEILYALRALFGTHRTVTRVQFHNFVTALNIKTRYPGYDSVNFAQFVPAVDLQQFEAEVRRDTTLDAEGYPGFAIKPPGERAEYYVLVYLEPMRGYEFAFGRDLGASTGVSDPQLVAEAQRAARDTGDLAASGQPIRIRTATEDYIGLAMRLPVYRSGMPTATVEQRRAAYLGSVGAGFNINKLMHGVLDEKTSRYIHFKLYDAGSVTEPAFFSPSDTERLLYDSGAETAVVRKPRGEEHEPVFRRVLPIEVGGRTWEIHFTAEKKHVLESVDSLLPWVVLVGGILSSTLLFGVLSSLASSRSRAVSIANEITKDLRLSEANLRTSTEQLTALSRRLVEVQEAERRQLSRELHDRVGQNLTALSINLDILRTSLPGEDRTEIRSRLRDSSALLESTVDSIEDVMAELRPPMLDDYGLLPALHWYAKDFSKRTGVEVEVSGNEGEERAPPEMEIALFRIAQEALTNVAKHAHAKRARVEFDHTNSHCAMLVTDDGIGIEAVPQERRGLGMVTMRERAQAIGGRFEVRTAPGGGTQIAIDVGSHGDTRSHRG